MLNRALAEQDFRKLVNYGRQPPVQHWYDPPLACHGFCVVCAGTCLQASAPSTSLSADRRLRGEHSGLRRKRRIDFLQYASGANKKFLHGRYLSE